MRPNRLTRRLTDLTRADQLLAGYVAACLLLGGASAGGAVANGILQLAAVAIIAWLLTRSTPNAAEVRSPRLFRTTIAGLGLLALLQLVPLPPALWSSLPGRMPITREYALLGQSPPWLPLSLAPDRAVSSLLALLPFLATLMLAMRATAEGRVAFAWAATAVAALSIPVGAAQLFSGGSSPLYFYQITSRMDAVGFFANRNHLATLFLMTLPFVAALAARNEQSERKGKARRRPLYLGCFAFLTFGTALNGSSAGLALLGPCIGVSALIYLRAIGRPVSRTYVAIGAAVMAAALLFVSVGPYRGRFLDKAINGGNSATRATSISLTAKAARDFFPLGSGVGTFRHVYTRYENLQTLNNEFVNHAHNDWVEVALETGLLGVALLGGLVAWLMLQATGLWKGADRTGSLARAGLIAVVMLMLHSLVDYPARTAAILSMAGAALGMVAVPRPASRAITDTRRTERTEGDASPTAKVFVAD